MHQRGGSLSGKRTDPDVDVFREAMRDVKPIAPRARVPAVKRKPPAKARFTAADRAMVLVESLQGFADGEITDSGDEISFRRAGVQNVVLRKLKRGEYRVEEICDLHGLRVDEAKAALREFLAGWPQPLLYVHPRQGHMKRGRAGHQAANMIFARRLRCWHSRRRRVDGGNGAINVLLQAWHPNSAG
jgi:hypothetical protein